MKNLAHTSLSLTSLLFLACGGSDISIGGNDGGSDTSTADASTDTTGNDVAPQDGAMDSPANDAAEFDPSSVSGLVLWLDASKGVTQTSGAISQWADQTTFMNNATQPTTVEEPTFTGTAINGHPAVHFDKDAQGINVGGDMLVIADSASLQWGMGDFYVVVVARFDNTLADGAERGEGLFFSKTSSGSNFPGPFLVGNIPTIFSVTHAPAVGISFSTSSASGDYVTTTTAYNDNTPHAFAMQRVGTTLDLRIDGTSVGTSVSSGLDISNAGSNVTIGADGNGQGVRLDGDIAEVLAVKGVLQVSDRTGLESYVKTKYGL
jgi:hypothetical protein